ncbi:secretory phospholipase A2 receptor-like [Hemibagrus wyckioides]|uniref:secretory phospholipase A2 receptor-like n=1 Tax=Hemibagrus wyckioides TaxID=337641 RepID=UPI00266D4F5C|nr:secretory phospholipase A2 receptor-like [Hemibagrus wyckioides]
MVGVEEDIDIIYKQDHQDHKQKVKRQIRLSTNLTINTLGQITFTSPEKYMRNITDMVGLISINLLLSVVCHIGAYIPHRYHFVNENKTWSEAQTYCREKYTDLATINNMREMKKLNHTLMKENAKKAWIGLQREGPGKWQWSLADQTFYRDGDTYRN